MGDPRTDDDADQPVKPRVKRIEARVDTLHERINATVDAVEPLTDPVEGSFVLLVTPPLLHANGSPRQGVLSPHSPDECEERSPHDGTRSFRTR